VPVNALEQSRLHRLRHTLFLGPDLLTQCIVERGEQKLNRDSQYDAQSERIGQIRQTPTALVPGDPRNILVSQQLRYMPGTEPHPTPVDVNSVSSESFVLLHTAIC